MSGRFPPPIATADEDVVTYVDLVTVIAAGYGTTIEPEQADAILWELTSFPFGPLVRIVDQIEAFFEEHARA